MVNFGGIEAALLLDVPFLFLSFVLLFSFTSSKIELKVTAAFNLLFSAGFNGDFFTEPIGGSYFETFVSIDSIYSNFGKLLLI